MPNDFADPGRTTDWYLAGTELSADAVPRLEQAVASNPDDIESRVKLLGFYFALRSGDEPARAAAQPHILWVISNLPDAALAGEPWVQIRKRADPARYDEAREAWCENLTKHPGNAQILGNAAKFFLLNEMALSEQLLTQAQTLEPGNSEWSEQLGHLFFLKTIDGTATEKSKAFRKSLESYEAALQETGKPRFYQLDSVAKAALDAGDIVKARSYSEELLRAAPDFQDNWNYGNAIYTGNSILGIIALLDENIELAREYLLAASLTPGSPQLDSFCPDLTLAKKMLEKGEADAVTTFLTNISRFWKGRDQTIQEWQEIIRRGEVPSFRR